MQKTMPSAPAGGIFLSAFVYIYDMKTKKLIADTCILTSVSLLMRGVGLMFSSYLSRRIGAEGLGLLEQILSVCGFAVSLAASGIKLTTVRLTVSAASRGMSTSRTVRMCFLYALAPATLAMMALVLLSPTAARIIGHPDAQKCFLLYAPALPFISVSCVLSGYFTAARKAGTYAVVSTAEQFARMGLTAVLLTVFLPRGAAGACTAVVLGQCISEALGVAVTMLVHQNSRPKDAHNPACPKLSELLRIALPDSISSNLRSALVTVRQILIPRTLRQSGISGRRGMAAYGVVQGMALPVINFLACVPGAFSGLIIPEIAECVARGSKTRAERLMKKALTLTFLFSLTVAAAVYILAPVLGRWLFDGGEASFYIRLLAPVIPVSYVDLTCDGILKGLGLQMDSMRYNIIEAAVCLSMVLVLVPRWGIWGYVAMIFMGEILNFGLSINRLRRYTEE